eukprot:3941721-Rhodomonas_salina.4
MAQTGTVLCYQRTACDGMPGTDSAYGPTRTGDSVCGLGLGHRATAWYHPTRARRDVRYWHSVSP